MNAGKIAGLSLIVAGVLGLAYGSFTYPNDTPTPNVGPSALSAKDKETVNVPIWAGVVAFVACGALLLFAGKRR